MKKEQRSRLRELADAMHAFTDKKLTRRQGRILKQVGVIRRDRNFGGWKLVSPISALSTYLQKNPGDARWACCINGIPVSYDASLKETSAEITGFTTPPNQEESGVGGKWYGISVQAYRQKR